MRNAETEELKRSERTVHMRCPQCSRTVFLVRHNGGSVWVDELGGAWPRHECFDREKSTAKVAPLFRLDDLLASRKEKRCHFCSKMVKPWLYRAHVVGFHKLSPAAIICAEAFEIQKKTRAEGRLNEGRSSNPRATSLTGRVR
jgi:hypothetical protein